MSDPGVTELFAANKNYNLSEIRNAVGVVFGYSDLEDEMKKLIGDQATSIKRSEFKIAIEKYAKSKGVEANKIILELRKANILTDKGKTHFSVKSAPAASVEQRATRGQKSVQSMAARQSETSVEERIANMAQLLYGELGRRIRDGEEPDDVLQEYQQIAEALVSPKSAEERASLIAQAYNLMDRDIPDVLKPFISGSSGSGASRTDQPFQAQEARGFTGEAAPTSAAAAAAAAAMEGGAGAEEGGAEEGGAEEGGASQAAKEARGRAMQRSGRQERVESYRAHSESKRLKSGTRARSAATRSRSAARGSGSGMSVSVENPASVVVSVNNEAGGAAEDAEEEVNEPLPPPVVGEQAGEEGEAGGGGGGGAGGEGGGGGAGGGGMPPPGEGEEGEEEAAQITSESTRQSELSATEVVSLQYKSDFTEALDTQFMRLATDRERGNLGAGTLADIQSADLWGNLLTQARADKIAQPERFIPTQPGSTTMGTADAEKSTEDVYSFLPFAKLGGAIVWIPRHVQAARFFFTSDDYTELVSHVRDGNPLTLDAVNEVDPAMMRNTITNSTKTLMMFCQLTSPLPTSSSTEQVYAEWLEIRQIGKAVARYQQITGGMYENTDLTMKGGIRAAVASALKPFIQAWNQLHPNQTIATEEAGGRPASRPLFSAKRKAEAGIVLPEEYNPQFSYEPVDLKRVKFSIPTI